MEKGYPVAEWHCAKTILMHTPGHELFDGIINPAAGLFEHYFDVEAAVKEHKQYIDFLQKNGIRVITIEEILERIDIEVLRSMAADVLVYRKRIVKRKDIQYCSEEYLLEVISQMTRHDLMRILLLQPEVILRSTDNNTGLEANYIHHPLMNLYFTRDQSITTPNGHIICQMNSYQRAAETDILKACYNYLGETPVLEITGDAHLEGGDYYPAGDVSFIGCGMRTDINAIRQIMNADGFGHDTVIVVKDNKHWQMQMHLDTYFNIIDRNLCTLAESRLRANPSDPEFVTADIYSVTGVTKRYELVSGDVPFVELLKDLGYTIIPIPEADELHYANNFLTIAPRHIMAVSGQSDQLKTAFAKADVKVEWVPLDNLINGYGAAHCMTQVLSRK